MLLYVKMPVSSVIFLFFFFNDTATTEIYTLSLHDALPISRPAAYGRQAPPWRRAPCRSRDRKSTRLNSSHSSSSYAVFCLKKKKQKALNTDSGYNMIPCLGNKRIFYF